MKAAIIGPGLQCRRRAPVIAADPDVELALIAGTSAEGAQSIADECGAKASGNWLDILEDDSINVVLVCTPPHVHEDVTVACLDAGKHVLCEKPLCRTLDEADRMVEAASRSGKILKCGFNHRHHPAIWEAKQRLDRGELGDVMFSRCRYGIIGRPDYVDEWRADPSQAAGGHFIEQGTHAIDLFRWFLGDLVEVSCMSSTHYFKDQGMDDGGMAMFRAANGATASLHTTLTQWKNLFSFEVFGTEGYAQIEGLGGGYGTEKLIVGRKDFSAPFQDQVTHYRGGDKSWKSEWTEFMSAIREGRAPIGDGADGRAAMQLSLAAYQAEKENKVLTVAP